MSFAVRDFFHNGGQHAVIVRIDNHSAASGTTSTSLDSLNEIPIINLLCIPPPDFEHDIDEHTWREATRYCMTRRALLIIDPPSRWTSASQVLEDVNAGKLVTSPNAVLYFPRLLQKDPLSDNKIQTRVSCGAVAGTISRLDEHMGVWTSPAGVSARLYGIEGFSVVLNSSDYSQLSVIGINCLRTLPRYEHVIWGARTLHDASSSNDWKYLPVRRTALHVEQSISLWLDQISFESNSETLWAEIRRHANTFLYQLYQRGAFQGQSVEEVFFVRCDETTTSLADVAVGRVNIMVGLALLKPAEFVILDIRFNPH